MPDPSTFADALRRARRARRTRRVSARGRCVVAARRARVRSRRRRRPDDPRMKRSTARIIGGRMTAVEGAAEAARSRGFHVHVIDAADRRRGARRGARLSRPLSAQTIAASAAAGLRHRRGRNDGAREGQRHRRTQSGVRAGDGACSGGPDKARPHRARQSPPFTSRQSRSAASVPMGSTGPPTPPARSSIRRPRSGPPPANSTPQLFLNNNDSYHFLQRARRPRSHRPYRNERWRRPGRADRVNDINRSDSQIL